MMLSIDRFHQQGLTEYGIASSVQSRGIGDKNIKSRSLHELLADWGRVMAQLYFLDGVVVDRSWLKFGTFGMSWDGDVRGAMVW